MVTIHFFEGEPGRRMAVAIVPSGGERMYLETQLCRYEGVQLLSEQCRIALHCCKGLSNAQIAV